MGDRPATKGKRLLRLAGMTARVASNYTKSRIKSVFQSDDDAAAARVEVDRQSGELIAKTLGELKGAVMKVGQMASIAKDVLPKELAHALTSLQREAPPMDYEVIAEQIEAELGAPPEVLFERFDREAFASASVGQVHRARTDDGREVVVKVQYPGVDSAVDSDLQQVKLALRLGGLVKVPRDILDAMFEELRARLHEELDYCNEADNVRKFREFHADHAHMVLPEVVGERSAKRVLTMTYEPGRHLFELGAEAVDQGLRDRVGHALGDMITRQIFELGAIHGDPNPANFAWREDGRLVIYDFGCVKVFQGDTVQAVRDIVTAARDRSYPGLDQAMWALGPLRRERSIPPEYYDRWLHALAPPLHTSGDYDFGAADLGDRVKALVPSVMRRANWWQPAPELAILDRTVAGIYDNLKGMKARVPARELMVRFLD